MSATAWKPAADLVPEWGALSPVEQAAVELVVYDLLNRRKPLTASQQKLVDETMQLPLAQKLNARKYQLAA